MFGHKYPECDLRCVTYTDEVIELEGGGDLVAGIIAEPVMVPTGSSYRRLNIFLVCVKAVISGIF
jgi:hypothetical protein